MPESIPRDPEQGDATMKPDFASPENLAALPYVIDLILDVRREANASHRELARKVRLYERSLGLLVLPTLIRRAAIAVLRKSRHLSL
jgi:hypothetical protein